MQPNYGRRCCINWLELLIKKAILVRDIQLNLCQIVIYRFLKTCRGLKKMRKIKKPVEIFKNLYRWKNCLDNFKKNCHANKSSNISDTIFQLFCIGQELIHIIYIVFLSQFSYRNWNRKLCAINTSNWNSVRIYEQFILWRGQWDRWHLTLQYLAILQRLHFLTFVRTLQ